MTNPLIVIAAIVGAHGVRGEAKLRAFGDAANTASYGPFLDKDGKAILTPKTARSSGGEAVIVSFNEPVTREQIMAMKGTLLHVPRSALPEPGEDEFYYSDLIGLSAEHLDGAPAGRVKAVHDFGAGDILELTTPEGALFIPFTREAVPVVEIAKSRLVINPPETIDAGDEGVEN
ncbi:ribosome maturation factor RimM [Glycocaulis abyssi]|uniref:Ribosome maturation factor RimM n=1 Tax=Glycocaulis abyssi TaxID=1433403 RepID=A0ABV9ND57_9PROT